MKYNKNIDIAFMVVISLLLVVILGMVVCVVGFATGILH
jgi:hypothetical protein